MKTLAPIVLFTYNRLDCLRQTIDALKNNELASESDLFIFSDGPKPYTDSAAVFGVRTYLQTVSGFKAVHIREAKENRGLAKSIIAGVTEIVNRYGKIIVLEDDLVTSHHFLSFMNEALDFYENNDKVAGIQGWRPLNDIPLPETFFTREVGCWGWATWKRAWDLFEADGTKLLEQFKTTEQIAAFDYENSYTHYQMLKEQVAGKVDSWAIRWYASVFLKGRLGLQPGHNLVRNAGFQNGTHFSKNNIMPEDILSLEKPVLSNIDLEVSHKAMKEVIIPYKRLVCTWYKDPMAQKTASVSYRFLRFTIQIFKCLLPYGVVRFLQRKKK